MEIKIRARVANSFWMMDTSRIQEGKDFFFFRLGGHFSISYRGHTKHPAELICKISKKKIKKNKKSPINCRQVFFFFFFFQVSPTRIFTGDPGCLTLNLKFLSFFFFFSRLANPTSNGGMQSGKLGRNTYTLRTRFFFFGHVLGADSHARSVL